MRNRLTAFTAAFLALCVIVGLGYCVVLRNKFPSVGIEKVHHVDDLKNLEIVNNVILPETTIDRMIPALDTLLAANAFIVKPSGEFHQYRGSFAQTAEVVKILTGGEDIEIGETIEIIRNGGLEYIDGKVRFNSCDNVMYPEYNYLVLVESSQLNDALTVKQFYVENYAFGVINADADRLQSASEDFNECEEIDIFCTTDEAAEKVYQAQKELLTKYGL